VSEPEVGKPKTATELSALGASKGGLARAEKLTPEARTEIARAAALKRWGKPSSFPRAAYGAPDRPLRIGNIQIPCYVLEDERRVLSARGVQTGIGMSYGGGGGKRYGGPPAPGIGAQRIGRFLASLDAKGLDTTDLTVRIANPIVFIPPQGGRPALGYEATLLPALCDVILEARGRGLLQKQQGHLATQCEILVRAFSKVAIIALVDEATGFQDLRKRDALAEILQQFIAKELRPWVRTFPADFYKEIFRLRSWAFKEGSTARPVVLGHITNDLIYSRLAPGVLEELRRLTPRDDKGRLKTHLHRRLTEDLGHPKLREHLAAVVALLRISGSWDQLMRFVDHNFPKFNQPGLPFKD